MAKQKEKFLAPQEALDLHDYLTSEIIGYKKLQSVMTMAEDNELKEFMKESVKFKKENIEQMQKFIASQGRMQ